MTKEMGELRLSPVLGLAAVKTTLKKIQPHFSYLRTFKFFFGPSKMSVGLANTEKCVHIKKLNRALV